MFGDSDSLSAVARIERERDRGFQNLIILDFGCCKIERIRSGVARLLTNNEVTSRCLHESERMRRSFLLEIKGDS